MPATMTIKKSSLETWIKFLRETKLKQISGNLIFRLSQAQPESQSCCSVGAAMLAHDSAAVGNCGDWDRLYNWLTALGCPRRDTEEICANVIRWNDTLLLSFPEIADRLETTYLPHCVEE